MYFLTQKNLQVPRVSQSGVQTLTEPNTSVKTEREVPVRIKIIMICSANIPDQSNGYLMLIQLFIVPLLQAHRCSASIQEPLFGTVLPYPNRLQVDANLRVTLFYYGFFFKDPLNSILKKANREAATFIQTVFRVSQEKIMINQSKCGDIPTPNQVLGIYQDTDLMLFIGSSSSISGFAVATSCALRNSTPFRPIFGRMLWSSSKVDQSVLKTQWGYQEMIRAGLHQMMHVMGFHENIYKYFVPTSVVQKIGSVNYIVTPSVKQQVNTYFGCSNTGMPLQSDGSTSGNHWEEGMLGDQIMTPQFRYGDYIFISSITLALFKDSGFYSSVDTSFSENAFMSFGKNKGCSFLSSSRSCTAFSNQFCSGSGDGVTFYRVANGKCSSSSFSQCKMYYQYSNQICLDASYKGYYSLQGLPKTLEATGRYSRAYQGSVVQQGSTVQNGQRCFISICQSGALKVQIGTKNYTCINGATITDSANFMGSLQCPSSVAEFCGNMMTCASECEGMCLKKSCLPQQSISTMSWSWSLISVGLLILMNI